VRRGEVAGYCSARATRSLVLCELGFAPGRYVTRADLDESALTAVDQQTFCPYKGMCTYYDIGDARQAAWSYRHANDRVGASRSTGAVSRLVDDEPLAPTCALTSGRSCSAVSDRLSAVFCRAAASGNTRISSKKASSLA
jgi:hypothetical protein